MEEFLLRLRHFKILKIQLYRTVSAGISKVKISCLAKKGSAIGF